MRNLAVIPARGGSKRIPGKNIKDFLGKPIIAYSIRAALDSGLFEEVMVSTDSEEIKAVAEQYGAKVPFLRSSKNADDHATISDVMGEVLNYYDEEEVKFDHVCCLFSTAPFVQISKLKEGLQKLKDGDFISIVPVQKYGFPILRSLKINEQDCLEMNWPKYAKTRSQDIPEAYHDAGQFYWAKLPEYNDERRFYSKKAGYIILEEIEAQDIDTLEDWKLAEMKFKIVNVNG